jgi:hypothetical protein
VAAVPCYGKSGFFDHHHQYRSAYFYHSTYYEPHDGGIADLSGNRGLYDIYFHNYSIFCDSDGSGLWNSWRFGL